MVVPATTTRRGWARPTMTAVTVALGVVILAGCGHSASPIRLRLDAEPAYPVPALGSTPLMVAPHAPPQAQVDAVHVRPQPDAVWIGGYWHWTGQQFVWSPGYWTRAAHGKTWVPHQWRQGVGAWHLHGGYWADSLRVGR
jgi:WXXGXW repeat (2 copies)